MDHASIRYLEAKRTVDDRALCPRVSSAFRRERPAQPRVVEAGTGTGAMLPRLVDGGLTAGEYVGVDSDPSVVEFAQYARPREFRYRDHAVAVADDGFTVDELSVSFRTGDALTAFGDGVEADVFVAASFADLVPLGALLDVIETTLRPGGLAYLPLSFDGGTIFQPDHPADDAVERAYHAAIDDRAGRDSRAGRHLLEALQRRPAEILAVGASDWIVRPNEDGYPADEPYFLDRILDFVAATVSELPTADHDISDWLETRRAQLASARLTYVAHQYDILYRTRAVPDAD
jgi:hypothetical protein